jgi:hypothetical protein
MAINNSSGLSVYRRAINSLETLINNVNTSLTNSINTVKNTYLSLSGGYITGNLTVSSLINNVKLIKVSAKDFTGFENSFRTMLKGDSNYDAFVIPFRTGTSGITGLPLHGAALAFGVDDVQTYISTHYSSTEAWIGAGNADKINWKKQLAFKGDYATSIGNATNDKPSVVKQTYSSGTTWYRIWSDGFVEQCGRITATASTLADKSYTFTLPKAMTTTTYYVSTIFVYTKSTGNWGAGCPGVVTKTTTQCTVMSDGINTSHPITGFDYYICGY